MSLPVPAAPSVHVIVVNWNGRQHLADCLPSLLATVYPRFQVTVYDNGSTDDSVTWMQAVYPSIECVALGRNLGFAGANSIGMRRSMNANAEYVVLLNNDTRVDKNWLSCLVDVAESDLAVAACHSRQLTWEGNQQIKQIFYPQYAAGDNIITPISQESRPFPTPYAAGCCMLLRTSALRQIGLFDSRYFAYAEDLDLCLRAWTGGFTVLHVPDSIIYHRIGGSPTTQRAFWGYRNQLTTMFKNYEWCTLQANGSAILSRWFLTRYRVALKATAAAMMMLPGTMQRRRRVQALRARTDREAFELMGAKSSQEWPE